MIRNRRPRKKEAAGSSLAIRIDSRALFDHLPTLFHAHPLILTLTPKHEPEMTLGAPFNRIADVCFPALMVTAGVACGSYTFLHILFVQRAPRLAFNFNYWSEQQFTRLWKVFAPIADKKMKALVSPLASAADKVVLDIGYASSRLSPSDCRRFSEPLR